MNLVTLGIMKDIDFAEASTIQQLFEHHIQGIRDRRDEANEAEVEYRSGIMDPSRDVAQHEKQAAIKKKILKTKTIKEDKSIKD